MLRIKLDADKDFVWQACELEPQEIAHGALFLASEESSFVTASTFLVDGGLSAAYTTPL